MRCSQPPGFLAVLQIVLDSPEAGEYKVHVKAHDLVDDQSFSLVVSEQLDSHTYHQFWIVFDFSGASLTLCRCASSQAVHAETGSHLYCSLVQSRTKDLSLVAVLRFHH